MGSGLTPDQLAVLDRNLKVNGYDRQVDKLIEEMGELQTALMKYRHDSGNLSEVIGELADVTIKLHQVKAGINDDITIGKVIEYKVNRLEKRLNNGSAEGK